MENLAAVADGYVPDNIVFYTYAKLMNLGETELSEIRPNYIILDEFHRAGAKFWGAGVQNLLNVYPQVPMLGHGKYINISSSRCIMRSMVISISLRIMFPMVFGSHVGFPSRSPV